jgi:hypothetical protein
VKLGEQGQTGRMSARLVADVEDAGDEFGDEGFRLQPQEQGGSGCFVLSARVIRKEHDPQVV